ncbi:SDR family NAD(P)-dependent oxidoreductase [Paraburkholderia panacisoli]|uniref:SDR family NAD(P)-dependent oxidoreductase n=1 Tax=Paraburkholderia panacisoli TaxID=2603818 RepID=A0A5B0G5I3_9BURK|nr:SDR family NAD(P)-dependent oxidoreductase [Paraburkholderia panacisoli]
MLYDRASDFTRLGDNFNPLKPACRQSVPLQPDSYCATKFAVEGITECLAIEVAPLGIHVTVAEPGYFSTE